MTRSYSARAVKDRKAKAADKAIIETIDAEFDKEAADLKKVVLVDKLMKLVGWVRSARVYSTTTRRNR